ncbi:GNAT family N-acetyltransferase [Algicella marina]|uniref:GNAT family N-acetyltransferase n=1 Tax=Algicella marina TaxID=2683284 RepID=A0A6P1T364_9RHOB|nr:GNAT family N-acetyltransferase [Algicella marina]QHQ37168.1 GNAT family N-acetyltransferase [Algicella marina]
MSIADRGTEVLAMRAATEADVPALAALWHAGWQDGHAAVVPEGLLPHRDAASFAVRTRRHLGRIMLAERKGRLLGFYMLHDDELEQFYVAPQARGTGVAAELMKDAERAMAKVGAVRAWLACSVGNLRAARFYEKCGWQRMGVEPMELEVLEGSFTLDIWRYEKDLGGGG